MFSRSTPLMTACISHLFTMCSPATVSRFVMTIIIDPIKGLFVWPISHICYKVFKTGAPAITNCDSSRTIVRPYFPLGDITSPDHGFPASICIITAPTVGSAAIACDVAFSAPARGGMTGIQFIGIYIAFTAAITLAMPFRHHLMRAWNSVNSNEFRKALAWNYCRYFSWHESHHTVAVGVAQ